MICVVVYCNRYEPIRTFPLLGINRTSRNLVLNLLNLLYFFIKNLSLIGFVNSKKFFHAKQFWMVLWSNTLVATFIFQAASTWSPTAASKSEAPKSTLLNKSCSNQKILADLLLKLLKLE